MLCFSLWFESPIFDFFVAFRFLYFMPHPLLTISTIFSSAPILRCCILLTCWCQNYCPESSPTKKPWTYNVYIVDLYTLRFCLSIPLFKFLFIIMPLPPYINHPPPPHPFYLLYLAGVVTIACGALIRKRRRRQDVVRGRPVVQCAAARPQVVDTEAGAPGNFHHQSPVCVVP